MEAVCGGERDDVAAGAGRGASAFECVWVDGLPHYFTIDADGALRSEVVGVGEDDIEARVRGLLLKANREAHPRRVLPKVGGDAGAAVTARRRDRTYRKTLPKIDIGDCRCRLATVAEYFLDECLCSISASWRLTLMRLCILCPCCSRVACPAPLLLMPLLWMTSR